MLRIGLTGGIAAGKSEVARLLASHGAIVVDADQVAHETYLPGAPGYDAVLEAFGEQVLGADGRVDRNRLGAMVFKEKKLLEQLTDIVWPLTRQRVEDLERDAQAALAAVFVLEAPLLIEAGWRGLVDQVWFIRASTDVMAERLRGRGSSEADAVARISARGDLTSGEQAADVIIENDGDLETLSARIEALWLSLPVE